MPSDSHLRRFSDGMRLSPGTGVPASNVSLRSRGVAYTQRCVLEGRDPSSELDVSDYECEREVTYLVVSRARSRERQRRETEAMALEDRRQ